jgi:hypothetical protein
MVMPTHIKLKNKIREQLSTCSVNGTINYYINVVHPRD